MASMGGVGGGGGRVNGCWLVVVVVVMMIATLSLGLGEAEQVHHVVGGDRGWDQYSNLALWSSDRDFRVGDNLWFTYSAAEESITELRSKDEYDTCDIRNPIRMYTDGVNKVNLDGEGARYFVSGNPESCKNGLKLHVNVQPLAKPQEQKPATVKLAQPPVPSFGLQLHGIPNVILSAFALVCYIVLWSQL